MSDMSATLPGLARVRDKFLSLLGDRCARIAEHALAAWQAPDPADKKSHLADAAVILHQIAGSAGSLGLRDLGDSARACEEAIILFVEAPQGEAIKDSSQIVVDIESFVTRCQDMLIESGYP